MRRLKKNTVIAMGIALQSSIGYTRYSPVDVHNQFFADSRREYISLRIVRNA